MPLDQIEALIDWSETRRIIAVAASMLTAAFHMLRDGTEWHDLGAALSRTGVHVPDGKGFRPHVTLLRDAGTALPGIDIEPAVPWRVDAFTLMHSELGAQSHYVPLGTWPLVA